MYTLQNRSVRGMLCLNAAQPVCSLKVLKMHRSFLDACHWSQYSLWSKQILLSPGIEPYADVLLLQVFLSVDRRCFILRQSLSSKNEILAKSEFVLKSKQDTNGQKEVPADSLIKFCVFFSFFCYTVLINKLRLVRSATCVQYIPLRV